MEIFYRIALLLAGLINLAPSLLAFLPGRISASYGITVPDANYELLLRHRAVLFGLVGGLMVYAAITRKYYAIATTTGLISMVSFMLLYLLIGRGINAELKKVMQIDIAATAVLLIGVTVYALKSRF